MEHTPMHRVAAASAIGTILEWYDFALYNAMSGLVFNKIFFPSFDPLVGTLLAFLTYGVGMVARPVGGIICGRLGDHHRTPSDADRDGQYHGRARRL